MGGKNRSENEQIAADASHLLRTWVAARPSCTPDVVRALATMALDAAIACDDACTEFPARIKERAEAVAAELERAAKEAKEAKKAAELAASQAAKDREATKLFPE